MIKNFGKKSSIYLILSLLISTQVSAIESLVDTSKRTDLSLTVYNSGYGFITDSRKVNLSTGENKIIFKELSSDLIPESVIYSSKNSKLLEQNFDYDLLTVNSLLDKSVGQKIFLGKIDPSTGKEKIESAILLSNNEQSVFQFEDGRIEFIGTNSPYRFIFKELPANLKSTPTLSLLAESQANLEEDITLNYLSENIKWSSNYVINLNEKKKQLDLVGYATIVNDTKSDFSEVKLSLIAGDVNKNRRNVYARQTMMLAEADMMVKSRGSMAPERESLSDYHLYTLPKSVDVPAAQQKQFVLLAVNKVPYKRVYEHESHLNNSRKESLPLATKIEFKNSKKNFGKPLPAGAIRFYQSDKNGSKHFVGENKIKHTPVNEKISLKIGNAFDVRVKEKLLARKRNSSNIFYKKEIRVSNQKDELAQIKLIQNLPNYTNVNFSEMPYEKESANQIKFSFEVPPKGEVVLIYSAIQNIK